MAFFGKDNTNVTTISRGKELFVKRTAIIFFALVVLFTAVGLAPTGVRELNNAFFSLFINEDVEKNAEQTLNNVEMKATSDENYTEPVRIVIPKIGTDTKVLNPESRDNEKLNAALLLGAVRYPGSGDLESERTMFLFGHSSYLPVVHNRAFKTFNGIQNLKAGDEIALYGSEKKYLYRVEKVELVNADEGFVNLAADDHKLVLATCNSFGKKQERYVVTANFIGSDLWTDAE